MTGQLDSITTVAFVLLCAVLVVMVVVIICVAVLAVAWLLSERKRARRSEQRMESHARAHRYTDPSLIDGDLNFDDWPVLPAEPPAVFPRRSRRAA